MNDLIHHASRAVQTPLILYSEKQPVTRLLGNYALFVASGALAGYLVCKLEPKQGAFLGFAYAVYKSALAAALPQSPRAIMEAHSVVAAGYALTHWRGAGSASIRSNAINSAAIILFSHALLATAALLKK